MGGNGRQHMLVGLRVLSSDQAVRTRQVAPWGGQRGSTHQAQEHDVEAVNVTNKVSPFLVSAAVPFSRRHMWITTVRYIHLSTAESMCFQETLVVRGNLSCNYVTAVHSQHPHQCQSHSLPTENAAQIDQCGVAFLLRIKL